MPFEGYSKKSIRYLGDLKENNNREWFNENKSVYESYIKNPTLQFVGVMANELSLASGSHLLGKMFRIYKDARFSKDKRPYNAWIHLAFFPFTDSGKPSPGCSGFYLALEPGNFTVGAGCFEMPKQKISKYRQAVAKTDFGPNLQQELNILSANKKYTVDKPNLKRVPQGFDVDDPMAELLKHKQVLAWKKGKIPKEVYSADCVSYVLNEYKEFFRLYHLLAEI